MRTPLICALALALGACAAQPPVPVAAAAQEVASTDPAQPELECHKESATGTNMIHRVCERKKSATDTAATQESLHDAMSAEANRSFRPIGK